MFFYADNLLETEKGKIVIDSYKKPLKCGFFISAFRQSALIYFNRLNIGGFYEDQDHAN